ncbi:MAG: L,D-transpeptidase [Zetaproteobacteria bacterium]|nr:MAG: L,D-transpeptidase [Zetaproteobacteria bacterium]
MILVSIAEQRLYHRHAGVWRSYPVSTSRFGAGNRRGSWQTPLGRHVVCAKIGEGLPPHTVFRARRPVGLLPPDPNPDEDWIVGRILWLAGLEKGVNRWGAVDTKRRFIYIHGTPFADAIGTPASLGCIRMRIEDILALFTRVRVGERVVIRERIIPPRAPRPPRPDARSRPR